ncbi:MAG: ATP-binding cassette domain-containing protein [Salinivirgaceae bacterium]|jgi:molybdate transport system ATP-binding protein|nr:ATP-binding cassette domain-containing protein [Salinivirgaceae bacterium]
MSNINHTALNGENLAMNLPIINQILKGNCPDYFPELTGKKGVLFSNTTLAKFIEEEYLHEVYDLSVETKRSIRTFSSGEQKKALLNYLLSKKPDFLIVDNPFDALDVESVKNLKQKLNSLSVEMPIIQVFKRRSDLLPFISHAMRINNGKIVYSNGIEKYLEKYIPQNPFKLNGLIPSPLEHYNVKHDELIRFKNVNVNYGDRKILSNINWLIKPGDFWQLIGPNGSGKTTMLTMINGDNPKAFGENIELFGRKKGSGENVWQIKKLIGYFTPSMMELFKQRHSCEQMVVSGLMDSIGLYSKASDLQLHLAQKWLQLMGIYDKKDRPFISLSQVKQRMVLIARAMIKHPPLLILDEPSTGLDDYSASMLSTLINKMADESTTAILYVSHRNEPDLKPQYIYSLKPTKNGSVGFAKALDI